MKIVATDRMAANSATSWAKRISGITGIILAGGESRRMGSDKSLLPIHGARFIEHVYRRLSGLFEEVIIVTNSPGLYADLPCRKVPDIHPGKGALAGIHSGLCHSREEKVFVAACDMPLLCAETVRRLALEKDHGDVIIPHSGQGLEPLHAIYDRCCIPAMELALDSGEQRIISFFPRVQVRQVPSDAFRDCDPEGESFRNINTPQEYFTLRDHSKAEEEELPQPNRRSG